MVLLQIENISAVAVQIQQLQLVFLIFQMIRATTNVLNGLNLAQITYWSVDSLQDVLLLMLSSRVHSTVCILVNVFNYWWTNFPLLKKYIYNTLLSFLLILVCLFRWAWIGPVLFYLQSNRRFLSTIYYLIFSLKNGQQKWIIYNTSMNVHLHPAHTRQQIKRIFLMQLLSSLVFMAVSLSYFVWSHHS